MYVNRLGSVDTDEQVRNGQAEGRKSQTDERKCQAEENNPSGGEERTSGGGGRRTSGIDIKCASGGGAFFTN